MGAINLLDSDSVVIKHGYSDCYLNIFEFIQREDFIRAFIIKWSDENLSFIFMPQKVSILLWIKLIDGVFLGILATLFYILIDIHFLRNLGIK